MKEFEIKLKNYNLEKYREVLEGYSCTNTYYPETPTQVSSLFYKELLELSKKRCFICGETLERNSENGLYMEREHIINKKIDGKVNKALLRCKYNLIPICRTCNLKKVKITLSDDLKYKLILLENQCLNGQGSFSCNIKDILEEYKNENFDYTIAAKKILNYNFLLQFFYGDEKYINQFSLNRRNNSLLENIVGKLYKNIYISSTRSYGSENEVHRRERCPCMNVELMKNSLKEELLNKSKNSLEEYFIEWLQSSNMLEDNEELECELRKNNCFKKGRKNRNRFRKNRDNLFETMILLEYL